MKTVIEKVKGNLSGHRMTIKDVVSEVLKKSDPEFGDDEELNVNLCISNIFLRL